MSDVSYVIVNNAHGGASVRIPKPVRFQNINDFKIYLSQCFNIDDINNIFLIGSFGIKINYTLINELTDIYLYDKRLFVNDFNKNLIQSYIALSATANENDVQPPRGPPIKENSKFGEPGIENRIKIYQVWSSNLNRDCKVLEKNCSTLTLQINTMFKSLNILFQFASNFTNEAEKNFNNHYNHIKMINYKTLHKSWNTNYKNLQQLPDIKIKDIKIRLVNYLNAEELLKASNFVAKHFPLVLGKFNELRNLVKEMNEDKATIDNLIESSRNSSISQFKNTDVKELMKKLQTLFEKVNLDFGSQNRPITELNNSYDIHKSKVANEIKENADKLYNHYIKLSSFRDKITLESPRIFNTIANLQMKSVNLKAALRQLTEDLGENSSNEINFKIISEIKRAEDYLSLTIDLPLLFGFELIEKRRQFEWYDFYTKGLVNNIGEQISNINNHERAFREIWNKKFGVFLNYIEKDNFIGTLPNVDISLVSKNDPKDNNFLILRGIDIDREDIINYISILESHTSVSRSFPDLLHKNFQDMKKSTNNMKRVTKVVSSLGTITVMNESKPDDSSNIDKSKEDLDVDLNVIKGLKSRIRKLESLLHQQQYKNITNWPVIRNGSYGENRMSMLIDSKQQQAQSQPPSQPQISSQPSSASIVRSDPTKLLHKRTSSKESIPSINQQNNQSQTLDSSSIDKHLDNIKLKRTNTDLISQNDNLLKQHQSKDAKILQLKQQIESMQLEHSQKISELNSKVSETQEEYRLFKIENKLEHKQFENLENKLRAKDDVINTLNEKIKNYEETQKTHSSELSSLSETLTVLRSELNDATKMKNDLLSNMSSKETEFSQERNNLNNEIESLKSKLEEVSEDYENLMELTQVKHTKHDLLVNDLNNVVLNLMNHIKLLVQKLFEEFLDFCFLLESMGLLLVEEDNIYKIKRVKGLKFKKPANQDDEVSMVSMDVPTSKVIDEIENKLTWINDIPDLKSIVSPDSASSEDGAEMVDRYKDQSEKLFELFNKLFKFDTSEVSKFEIFFSSINFKENVQLADENSTNQKFFINAISKRFKDVEAFAKKQTKDNKSKDQEIKKMILRNKNKISINSFKENDLLLFLPTRIDRPKNLTNNNNGFKLESTESKLQPWAAFNVGAPHYFLKDTTNLIEDLKSSGKEWFIGRVRKIAENKVTEENFDSQELNPYQLSVGVTWYSVDAIEDK
ncbi:ATG11 [Candida pseudojiufengensis]|uniref:ATG11 n=1 Tax=Candida pseudojiufengensis TaxID=497109 RepID=UPI002225ADFF|nr:ATG11 [Candida pseudojiufengensis]KAI5961366.1 ATG11 [Candida pseudojiufengensis]